METKGDRANDGASGNRCCRRERIGEAETGDGVDGLVEDHGAMVEDFLKLCCGFAALVRGQIRSPQIDRI